MEFKDIDDRRSQVACLRLSCLIRRLTFGFCCLVVIFANELLVLHQIELVARLQLNVTHLTHEAFQMIDIVVSAPDRLGRRYAFVTATAFGSKFAEKVLAAIDAAFTAEAFVGEFDATFGTPQAFHVKELIFHFQHEFLEDRLRAD